MLSSVIVQRRKALLLCALCSNSDDEFFDSSCEGSMCTILETKLSCSHALLNLLCASNISRWQEATATALFAIDQPLASSLGSLSACFQVQGNRIIRALDEIEVCQEQVSLNKLRLWLLVVAAHLLTTEAQFSKSIVDRFTHICALLCVRTLEDLCGVLRGFFDHIPEIDRTVVTLWSNSH